MPFSENNIVGYGKKGNPAGMKAYFPEISNQYKDNSSQKRSEKHCFKINR